MKPWNYLIARFGSAAVFILIFLSTAVAQKEMDGATPAWSFGRLDAPVTIEVFNDYQCPPCSSMNDELKKIKARHGHNVRFIFRNFPLKDMHKNADAAAKAAEAAALQGKFLEMMNVLYQRQPLWAYAKDADLLFISYATDLGLNQKSFIQEMGSQKVLDRILADTERGRSLGVDGTPTLILNGKKLAPMHPRELQRLVDKAMRENSPRAIAKPKRSSLHF